VKSGDGALWRKAWYPEAPTYPVALAPGADPDSYCGLIRMSQARWGMRIDGARAPQRENRVGLVFSRRIA